MKDNSTSSLFIYFFFSSLFSSSSSSSSSMIVKVFSSFFLSYHFHLRLSFIWCGWHNISPNREQEKQHAFDVLVRKHLNAKITFFFSFHHLQRMLSRRIRKNRQRKRKSHRYHYTSISSQTKPTSFSHAVNLPGEYALLWMQSFIVKYRSLDGIGWMRKEERKKGDLRRIGRERQ